MPPLHLSPYPIALNQPGRSAWFKLHGLKWSNERFVILDVSGHMSWLMNRSSLTSPWRGTVWRACLSLYNRHRCGPTEITSPHKQIMNGKKIKEKGVLPGCQNAGVQSLKEAAL